MTWTMRLSEQDRMLGLSRVISFRSRNDGQHVAIHEGAIVLVLGAAVTVVKCAGVDLVAQMRRWPGVV